LSELKVLKDLMGGAPSNSVNKKKDDDFDETTTSLPSSTEVFVFWCIWVQNFSTPIIQNKLILRKQSHT
jgi:hypothetical protein